MGTETNGNKDGNNHIVLSKKDYRIFVLLTKHFFSATGGSKNIQKALGYRSRGTVTKHINKLLKLGIIECINPSEKVKFYRAKPGVTIVYKDPPRSGNKVGWGSKNGLWIPKKETKKKIRRRDKKTGQFITSKNHKNNISQNFYDSIYHRDGSRVRICRQHNISFIAKVTGPIEDVKWDRVAEPNHRFKLFTRHDYVPGVGNCCFGWIKSREKNELRLWLPERYVLPHELHEDVLDELGWKAYKWFSKKNGIGVGLPMLLTEEYAFEAPKSHVEFFERHGALKVGTSNGKAMIDKSKKPWVEEEYTSRDEASLVASELGVPGAVLGLEEKVDKVERWVKELQDSFLKFVEVQQKQWDEQLSLNRQLTLSFPKRQSRLDRFVEEVENRERYIH